MPTLSVLVDKNFVKTIDALLAKNSMYGSRSEFIKDAVREKTNELLETQKNLAGIRRATKILARKAVKAGYKGEPLTKEDRIKAANEMLKEHGFPPHQGK